MVAHMWGTVPECNLISLCQTAESRFLYHSFFASSLSSPQWAFGIVTTAQFVHRVKMSQFYPKIRCKSTGAFFIYSVSLIVSCRYNRYILESIVTQIGSCIRLSCNQGLKKFNVLCCAGGISHVVQCSAKFAISFGLCLLSHMSCQNHHCVYLMPKNLANH